MANYDQEKHSYTIAKEDLPIIVHLRLAQKIANEHIGEKYLTFNIPDIKIKFEIPRDSTEKNILDSFLKEWRKTTPEKIITLDKKTEEFMKQQNHYNDKDRTYTIPKVPERMDSTTHHINHIKEAIKIVGERVAQGKDGQIFLDGENKDHPFIINQSHTLEEIAEKYNKRHPNTIDLSKLDENVEKMSAENLTGKGRDANVQSQTHYVYR